MFDFCSRQSWRRPTRERCVLCRWLAYSNQLVLARRGAVRHASRVPGCTRVEALAGVQRRPDLWPTPSGDPCVSQRRTRLIASERAGTHRCPAFHQSDRRNVVTNARRPRAARVCRVSDRRLRIRRIVVDGRSVYGKVVREGSTPLQRGRLCSARGNRLRRCSRSYNEPAS